MINRRAPNKLWFYLKLHVLAVEYLCDKVSIKLAGRFFSAWFNAKSFIQALSVRCVFDSSTGLYKFVEGSISLYSFNPRQANTTYKRGLSARASELGEVYLLDDIDFSNGDTIIDCGANVGDLSLYFECKGLDVNYSAFEPSPPEFRCLQLNCPNAALHNKGLWFEDCSLTFYVSSGGADSSFIEPPKYDDKVIVETVKLDEIVSTKIKLLKLEAEGAEPEVLKGAELALSKIEYIAADLGFERGVSEESTFADVTNFLHDHNFELVKVYNLHRLSALFKNKATV